MIIFLCLGIFGFLAFREYFQLNLQDPELLIGFCVQGKYLPFKSTAAAAGFLWLLIFITGIIKTSELKWAGWFTRVPVSIVRIFSILLLMLPGLLKWVIPMPEGVISGYWMAFFAVYFISLFCAYLQKKADAALASKLILMGVNILISGVFYAVLSRLVFVNDYPFQLYWSEGNRFYDYSTLLGGYRYLTANNGRAEAFITPGMALPWGIPFLFSDLSIGAFRLYYQLVWIIPPFLLGWTALNVLKSKDLLSRHAVLFGLWAFLFLDQGPIYTPLILSAILVVLASRARLIPGILLVMIASYYAHISRWTWSYAPGIWAVLMTLLQIDSPSFKKTGWEVLKKPLLFGTAGAFGGLLLPFIMRSEMASSLINPLPFTERQPLLWDRLLPNTNFSPGILLAVLWATLPILAVFVIFSTMKHWRLNWMQKSAVIVALCAFFSVGLIASVKIGGGSNLHNLDMYLVSIVLIASIVFTHGWQHIEIKPINRTLAAVCLMAVLAAPVTYTLQRHERPVVPDAEIARDALAAVQAWTYRAANQGEVLFIDHRQLLAFGYIKNIPLVDDYEKKMLMDMAMSGNAAYFTQFYDDLANHRFKLIVNEPAILISLRSEFSFSEENNAYVEWVTLPLLCNYYPVYTSRETNMELLLPRTIAPVGDTRCTDYIIPAAGQSLSQ